MSGNNEWNENGEAGLTPSTPMTRRQVLTMIGALMGLSWAKTVLAQATKLTPGALKPAPAPVGVPQVAPITSVNAPTPAQDNTTWTERRQMATKATVAGIQAWQTRAYFSDVSINAVSATGGRLNGPGLSALIQGNRPDRLNATIAKAFADAVGEAWTAWSATIRFAGAPLYPAFAAFPGAMAPPMPNVPVPLMTLIQDGTGLMPAALVPAIRSKLGSTADEPGAMDAIQRFAEDFAGRFSYWVAACMITNMLGQGPVPTFAPPYVPVGPVIMGTIIPSPGHLMATPFPPVV